MVALAVGVLFTLSFLCFALIAIAFGRDISWLWCGQSLAHGLSYPWQRSLPCVRSCAALTTSVRFNPNYAKT